MRATRPTYTRIPKKIEFTQEGLNKVQQEIEELNKKRPDVLDRLHTARQQGDLSENGAYKAARAELSGLDSRLRHLTHLVENAVVFEKTSSDTVGIGNTVVVKQGDKEYSYTIVGGYESNPLEGKISTYSPIGKALVGKKAGDTVDVEVPAGKISYTILSIT